MRRLLIVGMMVTLGAASPSAAASGEPPFYARAFERAFAANYAIETSERLQDGTDLRQRLAFNVIEIGKLIIESGQICAADPFVFLGDAKPFTQAVPNGTFRVRLAVGLHPAGDIKDYRVAFARVDFSNMPITRWSQALVDGQKLSDLKPGEMFGYPVDAGTGSFYDPAAGIAAKALLTANPNFTDQWQNDGEANGPKVIGPYSFVLMLSMGATNIAMFHSGWGDGYYATWFGYDVDGRVAALVTDFNTIDWGRATW